MNRFFSLALTAAAGLLLAGCYEMDETVANVYVVRMEAGEEIPVSMPKCASTPSVPWTTTS